MRIHRKGITDNGKETLPFYDEQSIPPYKSHSIAISERSLSQYPPTYSSNAHFPSSSPQASSQHSALLDPNPIDWKKKKACSLDGCPEMYLGL